MPPRSYLADPLTHTWAVTYLDLIWRTSMCSNASSLVCEGKEHQALHLNPSSHTSQLSDLKLISLHLQGEANILPLYCVCVWVCVVIRRGRLSATEGDSVTDHVPEVYCSKVWSLSWQNVDNIQLSSYFRWSELIITGSVMYVCVI